MFQSCQSSVSSLLLEQLKSCPLDPIIMTAASSAVSTMELPFMFSFTDASPRLQEADRRAVTVRLYIILRLKCDLANVGGCWRLLYVKHYKSFLMSLHQLWGGGVGAHFQRDAWSQYITPTVLSDGYRDHKARHCHSSWSKQTHTSMHNHQIMHIHTKRIHGRDFFYCSGVMDYTAKTCSFCLSSLPPSFLLPHFISLAI